MTFEEEFRKRLVNVIWERGQVVEKVDPKNRTRLVYGWMDYEATMHKHECELLIWDHIIEEDWYEFQGTFDDNRHAYGLSMEVTCKCGQIRNRKMRLDESFGEVLNALVKKSILDE